MKRKIFALIGYLTYITLIGFLVYVVIPSAEEAGRLQAGASTVAFVLGLICILPALWGIYQMCLGKKTKVRQGDKP